MAEVTHRVLISSVSPEPAPDVRAAIQRALDEVWPAPSAPWAPDAQTEHWRFSQRPWRPRPIPRSGWGT